MKGLIERQELELIRLRAEAGNQVQWVRDLADNLIAEEAKAATLRARVARLETALEQIAGCEPYMVGEWVIILASAALAKTGEGQ